MQLADVELLNLKKRRRERIAVYLLINACIAPGLLLGHFPDGAPVLLTPDGDQLPISFSLSHCATAAAIAWSDTGQAVGVDIENTSPKLERVSQRFVNQKDCVADLLPLWTLKEAAYKAYRHPGLELNSIVITPAAAAAGWQFTATAPGLPGLQAAYLRLADAGLAIALKS